MPSYSYKDFSAMLRISKHRLDDELEVQAELQEHISTEVARRKTAAEQAKEELERLEGGLTLDFRDSEEKLTVGEIKAKVQRNERRIKAYDRWLEAREALEQWEGLLDAWRKRGYGINTAAQLYASQYFSLRSVSAREPIRPRESRGERAAGIAEQSAQDAGIRKRVRSTG